LPGGDLVCPASSDGKTSETLASKLDGPAQPSRKPIDGWRDVGHQGLHEASLAMTASAPWQLAIRPHACAQDWPGCVAQKTSLPERETATASTGLDAKSSA